MNDMKELKFELTPDEECDNCFGLGQVQYGINGSPQKCPVCKGSRMNSVAQRELKEKGMI